ncbi:hypothetical protein LWE61_18605 [Sphingobium sufflavum]|uniref:uracil-DNA glycosylase family protein n=1 Tax=Sphingobium sufflavum TaxID=1129547 RepID=UPI001F1B3894|nr:uracil-DNA glycosylase family protein [Sphingobium sufflavum]MCE7798547.1 hypothetical protein [Sphingobium sufflavum]
MTDSDTLAASLTHWWALAGVDMAVGESPHNWLVRDRPAAGAQAAQPVFAPLPQRAEIAPAVAPEAVLREPVAMPDDLDGFLAWLAIDPDQPEATFSRTRIAPHVVADADMLVITDMPTAEDMAAGRLFSGTDRALLGGMVRAVGLDVEKIAMASLLLARPAGGIIAETPAVRAAERLHHFIGLTNPRTIIILGDGTNRAFQQMNGELIDSATLAINHRGGRISAMLLPAPFVLLKHAERKAAAWAQLRQLATQS